MKNSIRLFADDGSQFAFVHDIDTTLQLLNDDLNTFRFGLTGGKFNLTMNYLSKQSSFVFPVKRNHIIHPNLSLDTVPVSKLTKAKYLGLIFDSCLTFKKRICVVYN